MQCLGGPGPERRSRDGVARVAAVQVELDTGVGAFVEVARGGSAGEADAAAAADLDVQALRVVLGTVVTAFHVRFLSVKHSPVLTGSRWSSHLSLRVWNADKQADRLM